MVLLFVLACTSGSQTSSTEDPSEAETDWIQDLSVDPIDLIGTTLDVRFTTAVEGPAWIEYTVDGGPWEETAPTAPGSSHRLPVIAAPYASVSLRAVALLDGERRESGLIEADAGGLTPEAPVLALTINNYTPPDGERLLLSIFGPQAYIVMMEYDGTVRWAHPHDTGDADSGLGVAQSVFDGQLLLNVFTLGEEHNETAELRRMNLLGEVTASIPTPRAHHFFAEQPSGNILWLRYDVREIDGQTIIGDALMHQPADGGPATAIANLWDLLAPPEPPKNADIWDWTHANWLQYSADRDSILMSTAHENMLFEFAPDGTLLQKINGFQSSETPYFYSDSSHAFGYPHGIHWDRDGEDLLMLQRRSGLSTAVRYALDEANTRIERVWSFGEEFNHDSRVLGEVQELSDGNYLVSWGGRGLLQVVTPEEKVLWELQTEFSHFFSHTTVITDLYNAR